MQSPVPVRLLVAARLLAPTLIAFAAPVAAPSAQEAAPDVALEPGAYLDRALDLMQEHSFRRDLLDWQQIRSGAHERAAAATEPRDTHDAIRWALAQLGDHHSFLQLPEPPAQEDADAAQEEPALRVRREVSGRFVAVADTGVAHVGIPVMSGSDTSGPATTLHDRVRDLAGRNPCGWIVDLRGNSGGNMWPMLAGIGPLLGNGRHGAFQTVDGVVAEWFYEDGASGIYDLDDGERREWARIEGEPVRLATAPPVAVLTDGFTASSGEAVAIAFRGRAMTRSFGTPTYGVPTANEGFALPDGANLVITTGADVDRDGNVYLAAIAPDVAVEARWWQQPDDALDAAIGWLITRPECSGAGDR